MTNRAQEPFTAAEQLAMVQGSFYLATGLWPVFHRGSFERVTGPKGDFWLVRTVGLLLGSAGLSLTLAGAKRRVAPETRLLGELIAVSLAAVDIVYAISGRIPRIYLMDAMAEALIAAAWTCAFPPRPTGSDCNAVR